MEAEILNFEKAVGPIPLSIKAWYRQIGTVCLCWDQEAEEALPEDWAEALIGTGVYLDPLVVWPPDYTFNEVQSEETIVEDDGLIRFVVSISPDYYQKDDTSGGHPYCFALPDSAVDLPFLLFASQEMICLALMACFNCSLKLSLNALWMPNSLTTSAMRELPRWQKLRHSPNGSSPKTIKGKRGHMQIDVLRDPSVSISLRSSRRVRPVSMASMTRSSPCTQEV